MTLTRDCSLCNGCMLYSLHHFLQSLHSDASLIRILEAVFLTFRMEFFCRTFHGLINCLDDLLTEVKRETLSETAVRSLLKTIDGKLRSMVASVGVMVGVRQKAKKI